jgi:phage tail sheath protein FI
MVEFIHPGVFLDEVPSGMRAIEGVTTSTTGFVGAAAEGPADNPVLVSSVTELERTFGDGCELWHAARAFFAYGGSRLFVQRVVDDDYLRAIRALEHVAELAIVAAPGAPIAAELVEHAERLRYRFAIVDASRDRTIDSSFGALYDGSQLDAPPSAFVAGVYARTEAWKPPADDAAAEGATNVVRLASDGTLRISGAQTLSSDPEWKYVNVRRYFIYLEHSIDRGTQWTVFEPNGEELWATLRTAISDFLLSEFRRGALAGTTPENAFFVRCDRTTMTQNDLDDGRLVCVVGVAPLRPAEFVIIQIGRWTADHPCG